MARARKPPAAKARRPYVWVEVDDETRAAFETEAAACAGDLGLEKLGVGPWLARLGRLAVAARRAGKGSGS